MKMRAGLASLVVAMALLANGCEKPKQKESAASPKPAAAPASATGGVDRTVLPIAEPSYPLETKLDARDRVQLVVVAFRTGLVDDNDLHQL